MTPPIAFDPGALIEKPDGSQLLEATLKLTDAGRFVLELIDDDGNWIATVTMRHGLLDEFVAQARAREADAA